MMKEQSSEDDKKDEEKKEKFAKIVAFILKCPCFLAPIRS